MLDVVRKSLVEEAVQSPNLLADLAGLETYIAESYDARSFIELLQNADDAGASRFYAEQVGGFLIVANDGECFSQADFESLCRSSASSKSRGETIGYRGIGFKSVVGVASRVHLVSDGLAATFCRRKTEAEIPSATKVPLIRVPHELDLSTVANATPKITSLQERGYKTIFVLEDLVDHAVATEFDSFDSAALLFLRNIKEADLIGAESQKIVAETKNHSSDCRHISIKDNDSLTEWKVHEKASVSIASRVEQGAVVAMSGEEAVVHAFLPTHEKSGLGAKVNGDFSTDPSRTKVVLDERSGSCIADVAEFVLELIDRGLKGDQTDAIASFVPQEDIRMAEFERPSFKRLLFGELLKRGKQRFSSLALRPAWFESVQDFHAVALASGLNVLSSDFEKVVGLGLFLRALGAKEPSLDELAVGLKSTALSAKAAVAVAARVSDLQLVGQLSVDFGDWKIWSTEGKVVSTNELKQKPTPVENTTLLAEKLGGEKILSQFLDRTIGEEQSKAAFEPVLNKPPARDSEGTPAATFLDERIAGLGVKEQVESSRKHAADAANSVTKWRSAEIQVMQYLESQGWRVTDVSKRNVGYDLEGISPDGEKFYFETKSLSRVGELFSLSTNEEVVARQHGKNYILALVHVSSKYFEIDMIPDPANHLPFVRQCKQWAWVCETYPFNPQRIEYGIQ